MKSSVTLTLPAGVDPFSSNTSRPKAAKVKDFVNLLHRLTGGGLNSRSLNGVSTRPTLTVGTKAASVIFTAATVQAGDTVVLNNQTVTATQQNARGTVTCTVSGIDVDDTVTLNGVVFTAKAAEDLALGYFNQASTDAACATSLAACINASVDPLISGVVTAAAATSVCTIRAVASGTGGNAITLASTDAQLAVSAATLENGAAIAAEQFDFGGTNAQTATSLSACINASAQTLITGVLRAGNLAGTVTLATCLAGTTVKIAGVTLTAVKATSADPGAFLVAVTDTADAAALVVTINAHPALKDLVLASSAVGVVTIRQLPFGPNTGFLLSSSDAVTAAVSGSALAATAVALVVAASKGKCGNQVTSVGTVTRLAASATRLAGGTESTLTF